MRIFIASSNELEHERLVVSEMSLFINRMLLDMGYEDRIEPEKWEYLDSSMGVEHKQDEYNRALSSCDGVVVLFWRKFGEYTESEFLTALHSARSGGMVRRLSVLFKETGEAPSSELATFKQDCASVFGVEPASFSSDAEFRAHFLSLTLDLLRDEHPSFAVPDGATLTRYCLK